MSQSRYICIHGHFYQPARENPWTGDVPLAPDAYPFHDWNARITAESYGPNAWSQIRDSHGRTSEIVNNYERINFDFGPTLLSWLKSNAREVYDAVLAADKASQSRFSGHGSAIAQCYNHMIMPLANRRDKETQIIWGIRDFQHRFGRDPEGVWLPETAVDLESLDLLAEQGIKFTVLAPRQIAATRAFSDAEWTANEHESVDPRHHYLVRLPSGRSIVVFVYNGALARAVAFERLLTNGDQFAAKLVSGFVEQRAQPQLVHIATDGETYGHHHSFGDMALAYALRAVEKHSGVRLTNYSEFLHLHAPQHEARILENTSWSCAHGVERWRSDCGCRMNTFADWNQEWRAPLRGSLDWLRDQINPHFERACSKHFTDPWSARNDFIDLYLSSDPVIEKEFIARHQSKRLTSASRLHALGLLRMQRHMMLMYSSCGWFFDDISGVEATIILRQAGWVIRMAREKLKIDPLEGFLERLSSARSNDPNAGDGASVFRQACPEL
jgi:alpha-amylase/alpha-mannosidase (GH57 family)